LTLGEVVALADDEGNEVFMHKFLKLSVAVAALALSTVAHAQMTAADEARKAAQTPTIAYTAKQGLYPPITEANADVKKALALALRTHKRVILDFGGDWCGDCQVLDIYFHQPPNDKLLAANFIKVNVNIGREDANLDLAHKYGVPLHGVPALAVLDGHGKVLFAQDKEFSDMRYMEASSVTAFLKKWKP